MFTLCGIKKKTLHLSYNFHVDFFPLALYVRLFYRITNLYLLMCKSLELVRNVIFCVKLWLIEYCVLSFVISFI